MPPKKQNPTPTKFPPANEPIPDPRIIALREMKSLPKLLAELDALALAATPRPWVLDDDCDVIATSVVLPDDDPDQIAFGGGLHKTVCAFHFAEPPSQYYSDIKFMVSVASNYERLRDELQQCNIEIPRLQKIIARLREALEWYADKEQWRGATGPYIPIYMDGGKRARKALDSK
jgi:hypothetical protein